MPYGYFTRSHTNFAELSDYNEVDASSSIAPDSSPVASTIALEDVPLGGVPFNALQDLPEEDDGDSSYTSAADLSAERLSEEQKAFEVLKFMRSFSCFSLRKFLETVFTSKSGGIRNYSKIFMADGGARSLMQILWDFDGPGMQADDLNKWVLERAAQICTRECSRLTGRASRGPFTDEAKALHVTSEDISVNLVNSFRPAHLMARYEQVTPNLQEFLKLVIGKHGQPSSPGSRNPDDGRTLITSMILDLRSRRINLHAAMNAILLWDNQTSKQMIQMLNRLGVCSSYPFLTSAIGHLSKDSVQRARQAANDPTKLKLLPYDNFNWMARAWEASALHGGAQHDQVSAMLIVLRIPDSLRHVMPQELMSVPRFTEQNGSRHRIAPETAFESIIPSDLDQRTFRDLSILHTAYILSEEIAAFSAFRKTLPKFDDPAAIPPHRTEQHYLPTFDQEQGSTRGNMEVLRHYFLDVLSIPKETFENRMFFVLGDRLTTARDRAAQDQRAVDRSSYRADHLSSLAMTSGLMHVCLNFIQAVGKNFWGGANKNEVSLSTLRDLLSTRSDVVMHKFDFYAWLQFLDAVLRSLIVTATTAILDLSNTSGLAQHKMTQDSFMDICKRVVDTYLMPSVDRLEADGVKIMSGSTISGHAVLLIHDLMTLREMRHAIKHGHPMRILRMLKYWALMFYAGKSYNYSHECMELLHNIQHDWPEDSAKVLLAGMLVNNTGAEDGFLEADLNVEHLNGNIKDRAHGPNATPRMLEKVTPAIGHVHHLTSRVYSDLGVEAINQHHADVRQHNDVQLLTNHFNNANIFRFDKDMQSDVVVVDLHRSGLARLTGHAGGHAKHLARHLLRLRTCHGTKEDTFVDVLAFDQSEALAIDEVREDFIVDGSSARTALQDMVSDCILPAALVIEDESDVDA